LIALAVGALESKQIGPRSHIWSEKELLEAGAFEFSETEQFIKAAEEFLPTYSWGIYDLLLLP
jgi:leukotriene-A4 hydrolase